MSFVNGQHCSICREELMFNFEELKVYFRGKFVDYKDAQISIGCSGFNYGLGVFTGMRAYLNKSSGKLYIFRPQDHFQRLCFSSKICRFNNFLSDFDYARFREMALELLHINKIKEDAYFRITVFSDENKITPKFTYKDSFAAYLYPMGDYIPLSGIKVMVSSWRRIEDNMLPARAKFVGGYVNSAFAKSEALDRGFDEAIFLDRDGHVVEGSAENIFLVLDGKIVTPPHYADILEGITRSTILQLAADQGIAVEQRPIDRTELYRAQEIFLSGTGAQVSPVTQVDSLPVGTGKVGPVSSTIQALYGRVVRGEEAKYSDWLLEA
jgi:branched-chain amino acid aminotransferase